METATGQRDDTICGKRLVGCLHLLDFDNLNSTSQGLIAASIYINLCGPGFRADVGLSRRVCQKRNRKHPPVREPDGVWTEQVPHSGDQAVKHVKSKIIKITILSR